MGMKKANVLVTAAGSIVAQGIIKSLKLANLSKKNIPVKYRIITTDMNAEAAGLYRSDRGILVPPASSPNYIDSIVKISKEQNICAIYVGSDEELLAIGKARKQIENETEAKIMINPIEVITIARDKWKTFEFLKANNIPNTASSLPEDNQRFIEEFGFPIVVKPREGYGSLHFYVVNSRKEMEYAISRIQKVGWHPLLQEYLKDDNLEFTSGITVDRYGKYIMSSISIRKIIKHGQTYKAFIDDFEHIRKSAEEAALRLGATGSVNIQAKLVEDEPKVFEINPRFSATCPIRSVAGINEPDIVFRNRVLGEDIKKIDKYQKLICLRYWNEVYIRSSTYQKTSNTGRVDANNGNSFILDYF